MTGDALMALFLLKCHTNISDRLLGAMFGESGYVANHWIRGLRDWIYEHDDWLNRGRFLSDVGWVLYSMTFHTTPPHCLIGSLILHFKLPGKRCSHFLSLGSGL